LFLLGLGIGVIHITGVAFTSILLLFFGFGGGLFFGFGGAMLRLLIAIVRLLIFIVRHIQEMSGLACFLGSNELTDAWTRRESSTSFQFDK
jgi:hypothetical protein